MRKQLARNSFDEFKFGDFDMNDRYEWKNVLAKKFDDTELQALLEEDLCQTQNQLAKTLKSYLYRDLSIH